MARPSDPPPSQPEGLPDSDRPLSLPAAITWWLFSTLLVWGVLGLSQALRPGAAFDLVNANACAALAFSLATYALVRLHSPSRPTAEAVSVRRTHPLFYLLAAAVGVLTLVAASWASGWVERRFPLSPAEIEAMRSLIPPPQLGYRVAFAALTVAVVPLAEEMLFRGALFRLLARGGLAPGWVVVVTALLFTFSHMNPRAFVHVLPSGLVLGALRASSGSLVPSLIAHAAFNGVTTFELLRGDVRFDEPEPLLPLWEGLGATALTLMGLLLAHLLGRRSGLAREAQEGDRP
ncbi:MAG TPA: type II CAAX endopeptidase family protein [Polyangiaceae bacterium]|nr:type II CAAX endopeptidase family protein [Polyangiaceae bacterium]